MQNRLVNLPQLKILAVDDTLMNLSLLSTWLKRSPVKLMLASSGKEAVEVCQKHDIDIILMDIRMPNMDGVEATRLIRKTERNLGTPVIAITAHAFREEKERVLRSGFDDFIAKPIDFNRLLDIIELWCTQKSVDATEDVHKIQETSINQHATFDWELALKRANNRIQSAQHLLYQFNKMLPDIIKKINAHYSSSRSEEVYATVHKFHGACCYMGVPKLQSLCDAIEQNFRNNITNNTATLLRELNEESKKVHQAITEKLTELESN